MTRTIEIKTPGRLHFGLTSFGGEGRQFGGLGMMLDDGGISLRISPASSFLATGLLHERVEKFAQAFATHQQLSTLPACQIEVVSAAPEHTGLGVGTQLGLAVTAGLAQWYGLSWRDATFLSQISGRGLRSAIGTHGFLQGGLLFDHGKLPGQPLGELAERVEVPNDWRIVLVRQPAICGLAGETETQTIDELPHVPAEVTSWLHNLINTQILPAAHEANWQVFSKALYLYGYRAGECFADAQGGPFASPEIAALVESIRDLGIPGAGQSSWGPTVFAVTENTQAATNLIDQLQAKYGHCDFTMTQANNSGAQVKVSS